MSIAENIKRERKLKKLTQSKLGEILNLSHDTISLWEKGKSIPDLESAKKLALIFDITLDELADMESIKNSYNITNSFNNNSGSINFKG